MQYLSGRSGAGMDQEHQKVQAYRARYGVDEG
jgi:hypothetical protein